MALLEIMVEFDASSTFLRYHVPTGVNGITAFLNGGEFQVDQGDYDFRFTFPDDTAVTGVQFGTTGAFSFELSKTSTSSTTNVVTLHDNNVAQVKEQVSLTFVGAQPGGLKKIPGDDPTVINNPPIGV